MLAVRSGSFFYCKYNAIPELLEPMTFIAFVTALVLFGVTKLNTMPSRQLLEGLCSSLRGSEDLQPSKAYMCTLSQFHATN